MRGFVRIVRVVARTVGFCRDDLSDEHLRHLD
jgi:hypothetical protein